MAEPKATTPPAAKEYQNTVSGAKISGTVYNELNKGMKSKYTLVKKSKGAKTPPEA